MKSNPKQIKLTGNSYAVLALLEQFGESTSYDIKQAIEISIQNFWPVPHTTAYEEPARLASGGYLSVRQEEGGRRRRFYSMTEKGHEALAACRGRLLPRLRADPDDRRRLPPEDARAARPRRRRRAGIDLSRH
jgi:DNA-binding PadR family transcriptional regulator